MCLIAALEEYLKRTSPIRRSDKAKTQLFLSVMKPFHPVSKSTIALWMKALIQEAGVGQQFSAHSIRGAASTAAVMKGMSISEVLHIADWSSDNVFKTFYSSLLTLGLNPFSIQLLINVSIIIMVTIILTNYHYEND